jgi:hypothetical protein
MLLYPYRPWEKKCKMYIEFEGIYWHDLLRGMAGGMTPPYGNNNMIVMEARHSTKVAAQGANQRAH